MVISITRKRSGNIQPKKKDKTWIYITLTIVVIIVASVAIGISVMNKNPEKQWGDAPDFTLPTIDGGTFTLSDHLGEVILIDFTAENCGWCCEGGYDQYGVFRRGQIYELLDLYEEVGSEVVFISIDYWYGYPRYETEENLRNVKEEYDAEWIFAMDNSEENVGDKYIGAEEGIPKIVIIDKNGNIYNSFSGLTSKNTLIENINSCI